MNASKETISGDDVWKLLQGSKRVVVASGKKILEFETATQKDELLEKVSGRTGNLRAPTVKKGDIYYVGFNEELYQERIN